MKNYVQPGNVLDLTAPYDVSSGGGFLVGSIFAIACADALSGAKVEGRVVGVFDLAKTSAQAWSVGDLIYWDNGGKVCTSVSTGHLLIGTAAAAAANPSATGTVRLNAAAPVDLSAILSRLDALEA
jgi:predicted RecA/RadA family phage recombinase